MIQCFILWAFTCHEPFQRSSDAKAKTRTHTHTHQRAHTQVLKRPNNKLQEMHSHNDCFYVCASAVTICDPHS